MRLGRASFRMLPPQTFPREPLEKTCEEAFRSRFGAVFPRFCVRWHLPSERENGPRCHVAVHLALAFLRRGNCGNRECWSFPVFRCPAFSYIRRIAPPFAPGKAASGDSISVKVLGGRGERGGGGEREARLQKGSPLPTPDFTPVPPCANKFPGLSTHRWRHSGPAAA